MIRQTFRLHHYIFATLAFLVVVTIASLLGSTSTYAATRTWDDGGSDNLFSTAANWSSDTVPVNGDSIVIDVDAASTTSVDNDLTGLSLNGISFTGSTSNVRNISGNTITIQGTITNSTPSPSHGIQTNLILAGDTVVNGVSLWGGSSVTLDTQGYTLTFNNTMTSCLGLTKTILGSGPINIAVDQVYFSGSNTSYTGPITVSQGQLLMFSSTALGTAAGSTTISGTGSILLGLGRFNRTFAEPFVFSGSGKLEVHDYQTSGVGYVGTCSYTNVLAGLQDLVYVTPSLLTLTGGVTLQSDFSYSGFNYVAIDGPYTSNGHSFTTLAGSRGRLITINDASQIPIITTTISDSQPTVNVSAGYKDALILNGDRQGVIVLNQGILMGTGSVSLLLMEYDDGIVDPGSAAGATGTLHFSDRLAFNVYSGDPGSVYHVDIKDVTDHDKLEGGASFSGSGGASDAVYIGNARLELAFVDGWSINQGDQFMIIENQNTPDDDADGTFNGLVEGAQFTIEGITFSITYTGGDGNDVVLTALNSGTDSTPTPPNTGMLGIALAYPALPVVLGLITAIVVVAVMIRRRARE